MSDEAQEALSPSFGLTAAFLTRHPRYRDTLSLTPENARFDRVLWNSSLAALRGMLRATAEADALEATDEDIEMAVGNLVEGVLRQAAEWAG
jgi:hypothetical protein